MTKKDINVGRKLIGDRQPCFIVAEMSGNHQQDISKAYKIIDAAAEAGVDAVKLQTYTPDTLTIDSDKKWFRIGSSNVWSGQTLYNLYKTAFTPWEWQPKLKTYGEKKGIVVFSTPFDETAVAFLEKIGVLLYKVASFENIDLELLKKIGQTHKPVILSRGLADLQETKIAVKTLQKAGAAGVAVLHCVSSYPAKMEQMNLTTIPDLKKKLGVVVGLSDHTLGTTAAIAAVALGAKIIEKHLTLSRKEGGPDAEFSLEPEEFKELVKKVKEIEKVLGRPTYTPDRMEKKNFVFRRSLFVVDDIVKGETLTKKNIRCIRPGFGLHPKFLPLVLGKKAKKGAMRGTPLSWDLIRR